MSDVTFSVNESTFKAVFNKAYPGKKLNFNESGSKVLVWLGVEGEIHIEGAGGIEFEDGNTFLLKELEIGWDKLILRLGLDVPNVEIGKFCLLRMPRSIPFWGDAPFLGDECLVEFPGVTLFTGKPDIGPFKLNLNAIIPYIVTEIGGRYFIYINKEKDSSGKFYQMVHAKPTAVDVDPISISDTMGKLPAIIQGGIYYAASQMIKYIPQTWMVDVVLSFLGFPTLTAFLLDLLDIHDDVEDWLMDVLNVSIGIDNVLYQLIFQEMLESKELFKIEDPYPFIDAKTLDVSDFGGYKTTPAGSTFELPAITAPVTDAAVEFAEDNMFIRFNFGI
ncbi:hypothetical protein [Foetidibacter luteolus]|uniref:hypothetical protein n=1 Tax=Foetidibacter luteolus TaxID=2608880 RepID=UPI00129B84E0|nr:hypothetical protein [Foetidibacter luteolus]